MNQEVKTKSKPKTQIEVYADYDESGNLIYIVEKSKGRLTLEEIRKALKEHEEDYYLLLVDCLRDEDECYQGWNESIDDRNKGDIVTAYPADSLFRKYNSETVAKKIEDTKDRYYEEKYKDE